MVKSTLIVIDLHIKKMKRARIKAMVTVPTRRKAAQDISVNEITNFTQQNEKNKSISDNICTTTQRNVENVFQEKQMQSDDLVAAEQIQDKHEDIDQQSNECRAKFMQNIEEPKKDAVQSPESSNATQSNFPTKLTQNRCNFMKPTPKFDCDGSKIRRNSIQGCGISTDEFEDDNRKMPSTITNNIKNNSVQSTQNTKDVTTNNIKNNLTSKVGQKRRILVSESARKLAEARREFHLKHENKTPDRSKLTMYDLIYYNPVTNPMKKTKESTMTTRKILECQSEELQEEEEEDEDDPSSAMPVPQVKVGPNGELIIDEQSLVIEQTNAKKGREVLAKEAIIDDDNSGNGFYKRRKKSKEWSKWETLKFYKALNTVGTDFLLMQSLFPNRTRQEIKLKFKKEEKVNRNLVEKALAHHQEFNTEVLEQSIATFESSEREYFNAQEKQKQQRAREKKRTKSNKRRRYRIVASSIAEMDASDKEEEGQEEREEYDLMECEKDTEKMMNVNKYDAEVYRVRPTRSGRLPKVRRLQGPDINTLDSERLNDCLDDHEIAVSPNDNSKTAESITIGSTNPDSETHHPDSLKTVIPNIGSVEPGSLVILSKESLEEPGKSVLQVYMISSDVNSQNLEESNITPVNISPELLATVTAKLSDAESVSVKECE
ncbi:unnamed protein product [Xylocopa violacea]|uniref:Myb-like domain-containing protein n=1 Tax=Xylocopa violacea TaxID=135666 RepID=A0ABP1NX01_XYLVO